MEVADNYIKMCSISLVSRQIQIKNHDELIFQHHIFLPFHTVHGVLVVRILEWDAISSSREAFC